MHDHGLADIKTRYEEVLFKGDRRQAGSIIDHALNQGHHPSRLYTEVVMSSQGRVGALLHGGLFNVAQEHLVSEITRSQMMHLRTRFRPRAKLKHHAVITAVAGDMHDLGPLMIADFLYLDGWTVDFLGANTPSDDLVTFVRQRSVHLVGLAATAPENLIEVERVVKALRRLEKPPKTLLGGNILSLAPEEALALGIDGIASDVVEAISEARRLVGLHDKAGGLDQYLLELGKRIQSLRKARRLSQSELAQAAALDRTYISAVEHGKQNLTLGAVMKLADALNIPFEDILVKEEDLTP